MSLSLWLLRRLALDSVGKVKVWIKNIDVKTGNGGAWEVVSEGTNK